MRTWRDSLDLQKPLEDGVKLHFIMERSDYLVNFVHSANAWLLMLRCLSGTNQAAAAELVSIMAEVEEFHFWARSELGKMDQLADDTA